MFAANGFDKPIISSEGPRQRRNWQQDVISILGTLCRPVVGGLLGAVV
jgi:hypothetical protein